MATLLSLLIVVAALNAITTAARKSQKPYFVPFSQQLYELDSAPDYDNSFGDMPFAMPDKEITLFKD